MSTYSELTTSPLPAALRSLEGLFYRCLTDSALTFIHTTGEFSKQLPESANGLLEAVPEEQQEYVAECHHRALSEKSSVTVSFSLKTPDGDSHPAKGTLTGIQPENGQAYVEGYLSVTSQPYRASKSLYFQTLFENYTDALLLIDAKNSSVLDCNKAALRMFKCREKTDLTGKKLYALSPELQPDGRSSYEKAREIYDRESPQKSIHFEWVHESMNGATIPVNVFLSPTTLGSHRYSLVTLREIGSHQRAEIERNLLLNLAFDINQAQNFDEAIDITLREITYNTGAVCGEAWIRSDRSGTIRNAFIHTPAEDLLPFFRNGEEAIELEPGTGFAGAVWESQQSVWIPNLHESVFFSPQTDGMASSLHSAVGVPVTVDDRVVSVLCFYFHQKNYRDSHFKTLISSIATQLGTLFKSKLSEDALRNSEQKYRTLFEESLSANFIASPEGVIRDCNSSYVRLFGFKSHYEARQSSFNDIFTNHTHKIFFWKALQNKQRIANHEMTARTHTGRKISIIINVIAHFGQDGYIREIVGQIQDITDRKQANLALKKSEERLRSLIESTNEWVWEIDLKKRFTYSSYKVRTILGYNPQKIMGKEIISFIHTREKHQAEETLQELLEKEQGFLNIEFCFLSKSGKDIFIESSGVPIFNSKGVFNGFRCISRDITERKIAEIQISTLNEELEQKVIARTRQLRLANKELEAFSYSVSHDLRAPLRSIDGFSQAFLEDYGDNLDKTGSAYLERVRSAAQRMSSLIDDMIKLSRVSRAEMKHHEIDLSSLAESIAKTIREDQPEISTRFIIQQGLMTKGDESLLKIALQNLFENAVKFTSKTEEPTVEFGCKGSPPACTYYVKDNGAGFNMKYAEKLFTPFQRLHREKEFPGTGIGLATVQRIIHRHMGKVWAEGVPDEGATFFFTLKL